MKMLIFFMVLSLNSFAKVELKLFFNGSQVSQGSLTEVPYEITGNIHPNLEFLKGKKFGDTLFIYDVSDERIKVVVFDSPKSNVIIDKIENEDLEISLVDLNFKPTRTERKFLYEDFKIDGVEKNFFWVFSGCIIFLTILAGVIFSYRKKRIKNLKEKDRIKLIANKILWAKSLEEIIEIWKDKHIYLGLFVNILDDFKKFEIVLNKYQFKPEISEVEKIEIQEAYRKFLRSIEGKINGI